MLILFVALGLSGLAQARVGDRLIVAINNSPYTQRQVEIYIITKESLRADRQGPVGLVTGPSWRAALEAFVDDAIIQQEAERLGSFQPSEILLKKARDAVAKRRAGDPAFERACVRLGVDERTVGRTLVAILRTEAFRRSKERQVAVSSRGEDQDEGSGGGWFSELKTRSVIRTFHGALDYLEIQPTGNG